MNDQPANVTRLLRKWKEGDPHVEDDLLRAIYPALRAIAARRVSGDQALLTLQPTELVHEAYMKLVRQDRADWRNREQFFAVAARVMRRILIDHLRRKLSHKRGAGIPALPLISAANISAKSPFDWLDLDAALSALEQADPRAAKLVELRYFAGLSVEEVARVFDVSSRTVLRDWRFARAFLQQALSGDAPSI